MLIIIGSKWISRLLNEKKSVGRNQNLCRINQVLICL